jgi:hypothetical protein
MAANPRVIPKRDAALQGCSSHSIGRPQWIEIMLYSCTCHDRLMSNKEEEPRKSSTEELTIHYTLGRHKINHNCVRRHSASLSCDCPTSAIHVAGADIVAVLAWPGVARIHMRPRAPFPIMPQHHSRLLENTTTPKWTTTGICQRECYAWMVVVCVAFRSS